VKAKDLLDLKEKLAGVAGSDGVSDDAETLSSYESAGLSGGGKPLLLIRPSEASQVRTLIKLANEVGLNLVFSSSGPPRYRGDTVPSGEAVIVDMSRMDRVLRVDRRNKVALIEPGVTFDRLKDAAEKVGLRALMPLLPRSSKSVLASYLEREPITIPKYHWDMTDPLLCTELVFGNGDLFRTGSAAGPGGLEQQWEQGLAQKNPMGPAQTDFVRIVQGSQGTMAAVTWATVKLELKPTVHNLYFVLTDKLERLVDFSYRALRPKLADEFFILNASALATIIADELEEIRDLAAKQAPYTLVYGITGGEFLPEQKVAWQEKDLGGIAQAVGLKATREVPGVTSRKMLEIISNPSPDPYFKTRAGGAFLDIFFLTTLDKVTSLISVMEQAAAKNGYPVEELGVYIQPIQHGRTCHLEFNLYYNPEDEDEAGMAETTFSEASRALADAGAFFSRPYGHWADLAYSRCPDTVRALKKVKEMVDPDGVLNRGKLCFKEVG